MTPLEINEFQALIHARLQELQDENALGKEGQAIVTLDQQSVGRLSRMDALQNQAMANAQRTRRDQEEHLLHQALARLLEDDYGYCEDCGDDIPTARLELNLIATRCISCASG
ncbi:TraR/DksA C4-type zinc finger protein [Rhodobacteraceae bacterium M382]|nr:TraR/DksA C4-type zinc finger protein [Rhodobacteraceae bacterium M382]